MDRQSVQRLMRTLLCLLFFLPGLTACAEPVGQSGGQPGGDRPPVGVNLMEFQHYSTDIAFTDAFKQASAWIPQRQGDDTWNTGETLEVDDNGWITRFAPGQSAGVLIFRDLHGHYPAGRYICTYDGKGQIEFKFDARVRSSKDNRIVLDVKPTKAGIFLKLLQSDPDDPVRNIRLMLPGFEDPDSAPTFNPAFVSQLEGFDFIRFMNWGRTNDSKHREWSERGTLSHYNQASERGVAYEHMIDLANTVKADPWLTLPHAASDNYVRELARLVARDLDPELKVYIELSNEVWNGQFEQAKYAREAGIAAGISKRPIAAQLGWYGQRASQMFDTFRTEFDDDQRLVRVLATQAAWPETSEMALANLGEDAADALAIAPYFGIKLGDGKTASTVAGYGLPRVFNALRKDIKRMMSLAGEHKDLADSNGLDLIAYEAGQHLVGYRGGEKHKALNELFHAANRSPEMETIYSDYLDAWQKAGGGDIALYALTSRYTRWGSWGLSEYMDTPLADSPKLRSVRTYISQTETSN